MDAPQIQYAKTSDGVNIAFWTLGEGMPVVEMPAGIFSHIQLEWRTPQLRRWYERVAQKRMLVRYDGRGTGLSDRDVADYSLDAHVLDLQAVVDRIGIQRFCLFGLFNYAPVAINYAVQHPERVSRLALWMAGARYADASPGWRAFLELMDKDWSLFSEAMAGLMGGDPEEVRAASVFIRQSVTPETAKAIIDANRQFDVTSLLPKVTAPTLVLHRPEAPFTDVDLGKRLASQIPNARLVLLEGTSGFAMVGDVEAVIDAFDEFLGEGETPSEREPAPSLPSGTAVILFADIADSTALTERLGDAAFRDKARALDTALRSAITSNGGTAIEGKLLGDGVLATFGAAREAIACAMAIHRMAGSGVGGRGSRPEDEALLLHVGIHAGDVIREEGNVYGGAVNIASRVAGEAAAGETLVSGTVRDLARTSAGVTFDDRGERELKGVGEPVRVWAVVAGR